MAQGFVIGRPVGGAVLRLWWLAHPASLSVKCRLNGYLCNKADKNSNLLGTLLWLLLFGFSSRYYQTVIQIERQYDYIHHLEELISKRYPNTRAFTREGKSYLDEYPIFSNWIWLLYTLAFPLIILTCIVIRILGELEVYETLSLSLIPSFVAYLLVGTSTVLYIGKLHLSGVRKLLTHHSSGTPNRLLKYPPPSLLG